ncbi:MAG TPA: hypothetical protein PLF44_02230, partial [Candidatus Mcinerneyibacteriales bacterium]|nr:hypothetical protein [Candidatus Mcinerneyibacteriales bacterium]
MRRGFRILLAAGLLLVSCGVQNGEVTFKFKTGYHEAQAETMTGGLGWRPDYEGYPWTEMKKEVKGVPENW